MLGLTKVLLACTIRVSHFANRHFLMYKLHSKQKKTFLVSTICNFTLNEMRLVEARNVFFCSGIEKSASRLDETRIVKNDFAFRRGETLVFECQFAYGRGETQIEKTKIAFRRHAFRLDHTHIGR